MIKLSDKATTFFCPSGKHIAMQSLSSLDELYEHAPETEKKFKAFAKELSELTGCKFKLGSTKDRDVAEDKIKRDYDGNPLLISDIIRGKEVVDSPEAIELNREVLNPENKERHPLLKKYNVYCAQMSDYYADPKYETDYRCINAKLSFPIDGTDEEYLVELQIVHEAIESTYHLTHDHMRKAQEISGKYKDVEMPNKEAYNRYQHYNVCKFYNGTASRKAGLDRLLINPNRSLSIKEGETLEKTLKNACYDYQ